MTRRELETAGEPRYIVYVEAPGDPTTRVICYRDSEHDTRAEAYTRLRAIQPQHLGRLVWIESVYTEPFSLDQRRYHEVPGPERGATA